MQSAIRVLRSAVLLPLAASAFGEPIGTAFTYQGRLKEAGQPANALYDMQFTLFDDPASVVPVAGPLALKGTGANPGPISVVNGLFPVELDFGPAVFTGGALWLEIAVALHPAGGANPLTLLTTRQTLTAAPYVRICTESSWPRLSANGSHFFKPEYLSAPQEVDSKSETADPAGSIVITTSIGRIVWGR